MNHFMVKTTAGIYGMACDMCETHVNDAIRKALDVKKVASSHRKNQTVILSEAPVSEEALKKALEGTGYEVTSFVSEPYEKRGLFSFLLH